MIQLILIPVTPTKTNPAYWDVQAGWLLSYVHTALPNKIQLLEGYLRMHSWEPIGERYIRVFSDEDRHTIPANVLVALKDQPWHVSIQSYPVGAGPEIPPSLFEEYDEERHG